MVNLRTIYQKLKKSYSKNVPELIALKDKLYPEFVLQRNPKTLKGEIPVFTLHSVEADRFEEQAGFLYRNGYQTLTADEFYECLVGNKPMPERAVLLTFDDGFKSLRTVAFPILKKYGLRAVCFIIPGLIDQEEKKRSNGELCSWHEIKEMHEAGVIDFQSHSMYHHLIFISSAIEDFHYPSFPCAHNNLNIPLIRVSGNENVERRTEPGTPIYKYATRFSGKRRYFDDENLRNQCIGYVKSNGGEHFFEKNNWRKMLMKLIQDYRKRHGDTGYFENEEELRRNQYNDLLESKLIIERKLPGKTVSHFCYPWWEGSDLAIEISKKAGYLTNFWGILPGRRTNRCGDDPYRIVRILSDEYLFRLPGIGRKSLLKIMEERFSAYYKGFAQKLIRPDY
jgi:peptidoglycan/xylan/chitin deacetylase (PgdA/CDA1 family)